MTRHQTQRSFYDFCYEHVGHEPSLWERSDPAFWRGVFKLARETFGRHRAEWTAGQRGHPCTIDRAIVGLRADKRRYAMERRQCEELGTSPESLKARYGRRLASLLLRRLVAAQDGLSCVDNERVAESSRRRERRYYRKCRASGCCGFDDFKVKDLLTGREFLVGFNFGH